MAHINILSGQEADILKDKSGDIYSYYSMFKIGIIPRPKVT
jgi:hypothetical protein